jgi:hypothetical protein
MNPTDAMKRIDALLSHLWMVRTFLKHSDEAAEDEELAEVHRGLYDFSLALGDAWKRQDADEYLQIARKKFAKLKGTVERFRELQPEVSTHMNFQMAVQSLNTVLADIAAALEE